MGALVAITEWPNFDVNESVRSLRTVTRELRLWLETTIDVDIVAAEHRHGNNVHTPRNLFLRMCGNRAKHNFNG